MSIKLKTRTIVVIFIGKYRFLLYLYYLSRILCIEIDKHEHNMENKGGTIRNGKVF